ncbi:MAG: hypothetical protein KDB01_14585 [Planctomycetaceae bacterium]|nr:hypothetical protein [Planctomycetaceae bacterium]
MSLDLPRLGIWLGSVVVMVVIGMWLIDQVPKWFSSPEVAVTNPYATDIPTVVEPPVDPNDSGPAEPMPDEPDESPPEQTAEQRTDFPGVNDGELQSAVLNDYLPDWLRAGWGNGPETGSGAVLVDPYGTTPESHRTLSAAFDAATGTDALIEIAVQDPISVSPVALEPSKGAPVRNITLRGRDGKRGTLLIDADAPEQRSWLVAQKAVLRIEGLDLVVQSRGTDASLSPFTLLQLIESDLIMRDVRIVVLQPAEATHQLSGQIVYITGDSPGKNRMLLENCNAALRSLQLVQLDGNDCDLLLGNCYLENVSTPLLRFAPPIASTNPLARPLRRVALLACSTVSDGPVLHTQQSADAAVPLEFRTRRCLVFGRQNPQPWIELLDWPRDTTASLEAPTAANVTFDCQHVRFFNRPRLVALAPPEGEGQLVSDVAEWRKFWKQSLASNDWVLKPDVVFPAGMSVQPSDLQSQFATELEPGLGARAHLGADAASIPVRNVAIESRVLASLSRHRVPIGFGQAPPSGKQIPFDLKRAATLQALIDSPECPTGATLICSGVGLKTIPPLVIRKKHIRLEFAQSEEGTELFVQPTPDTDATAWFRVEGGQLDLINAPLQLPNSGRKRYPATVLQLAGGAASLQNSRILGPNGTGETSAALIDTPTDGVPQMLSLTNCLLTSSGTVVRVGSVNLECGNLAIGTLAAAFELAGDQPGSDCLLFHCSLAAREAFRLSDGRTQPLSRNVFLRNCVLLPPPVHGADSVPAALTVIHGVPAGTDCPLGWWEGNSAYSPVIRHWLTASPASTGNSFDADRLHVDNGGRFIGAVVGNEGVLLSGPLPALSELTPTHFSLLPTCVAATRAVDGGPLGIRLPVGPDLTVRTTPETPGGGKPTPKPVAPRGPFRPDF